MKPLLFIRDTLIFIFSASLLVFFTGTISNDFVQYELIFDQIVNSAGPMDAVINFRYEPGFTMLYYFLSSILTANSTFFVVAIFILFLKYLIFLKYLRYPISAWIIYIILFIPVLDASQLRTAIASTIIIYLLLTFSSKTGVILKTIVASMFHYVALIIILFQAYKKPILTIAMTLTFGLLINNLLKVMTGDIFKLAMHLSSTTSLNKTVNYFNVISLSQLAICVFCIFNWRSLDEIQKKGGFLIIIGLSLYFIFGENPGIAHRIREVSLLGIFPLLFSNKVNFNYKSMVTYSSLFIIVLYHFVYVIDELIKI
ncbi:MAG: hypothetical protein CMG60_08890 [Candidatus Marinimicrobia bacterium]|nr:hypothetical protein [Candidatus Neomarinimicrobiota bacterium]